MVAISIFDRITIDPTEHTKLVLTCTGLENPPPQEENLAWRAADVFFREICRPPAARITLDKMIPSGAGLGGGSGNAAGVLMALNNHFGGIVPMRRLQELAAGLGADVPFFLTCQPSIARGIGEHLSPLEDFPQVPLVVVKPSLSVATGEAYSLIQPREHTPAIPTMKTPDQLISALTNDFDAPICGRFPELEKIKAKLREAGATGVLLSGSGSAVFGLFGSEATQRAAAKRLAQEPSWNVFSAMTLSSHSYSQNQ